MRSHSAPFREAHLRIISPDSNVRIFHNQVFHSEQSLSQHSTQAEVRLREIGSNGRRSPELSPQAVKAATASFRTWKFINRVKSLPQIAAEKFTSVRGSRRSISSNATEQCSESDFEDTDFTPVQTLGNYSGSFRSFTPEPKDRQQTERSYTPPSTPLHDGMSSNGKTTAAVGGVLSHLRRTVMSATRFSKKNGAGDTVNGSKSHSRRDTTSECSTKSGYRTPAEVNASTLFQNSVDDWVKQIHRAIHIDKDKKFQEAFDAYNTFNRALTKDAIMYLGVLTQDQLKLLSRIVTAVDRRMCYIEKVHIRNHQLQSTVPTKAQQATQPEAADNTLEELNRCLGLLTTVKAIASNKRLPVILVWREKRNRTRHRSADKGKSNQIVFPKEKREFLQLLGLPGKMINEKGIDFSVGLDVIPGQEIITRKKVQSPAPKENTEDNKRDSRNLEISETTFSNISEGDNTLDTSTSKPFLQPDSDNPEDSDDGENGRICFVRQCLAIRRRLAVSPQREESPRQDGAVYAPAESESSGSRLASSIGKKTRTAKEVYDETKSTLSCESCSSDSIPESEPEGDVYTDTAVLSSHTHSSSLHPAPDYAERKLYLHLNVQKVGVRFARKLDKPYVRLSIRDTSGNLVTKEQESSLMTVINDHYLESTEPFFIKEALEDLPEDFSIYLELRNQLQEKQIIRTHCYTFLEKKDLQPGDFICEQYRPPVNFNRTKLVAYSEKAFFLHLQVKFVGADALTDTEEDYEFADP